MNKFHKNLSGDDIHVIHAFEYANAAARTGASGFVTGDIGRVARQTDDNSFWVLTATTPSWVPLTGRSLYASATNVSSTTSSTTVLIPSMTLTPPAGIWMVHFSCIMAHNQVGGTTTFGIYNGGTQIPETERTVTAHTAVAGISVHISARFTANGTNAIQAQRLTPAGTTFVRFRSLLLHRDT